MACCFRQSRLCSDGTLSGLWLDVGSIPGSGVIKQSSICYYFDPADPISILCRGTVHTSFSTETDCTTCMGPPPCSCGNSACGFCATGRSPTTAVVSFSGGAGIAGCFACGGAWYKMVGSLAGTTTGTLVKIGACELALTATIPGFQVEQYTTALCVGIPIVTNDSFVVTINFGAGPTADILAELGPLILFESSGTTLSDCCTSFSATDSVAAGCLTGPTRVRPWGGATATVTFC